MSEMNGMTEEKLEAILNESTVLKAKLYDLITQVARYKQACEILTRENAELKNKFAEIIAGAEDGQEEKQQDNT